MTPHAASNDAAEALASELNSHGAGQCALAMVLGSGLGSLVEELKNTTILKTPQLKHLPGSSVVGHAGRIVIGEFEGVRVLIQQGRVHLYEGWGAEQVTRAVRAFALLGIQRLVLTNAAGCLRKDWKPGGFMQISDHINLQGRAGLLGREAGAAAIYDDRLGALAQSVALEVGVDLPRGIYAGLLGPSYETPAEIRMLQALGAQAVGMSTVAEACAARSAGMRVLGLSCLTNYAAGIEPAPLCHADVVRAGNEAKHGFVKLCRSLLPLMANRMS